MSIGVPPRRINEIVHGKRGITADTALRLGKLFGTTAQFWLNLQTLYDLDLAEDRAAEQIDAIVPLQPHDLRGMDALGSPSRWLARGAISRLPGQRRMGR